MKVSYFVMCLVVVGSACVGRHSSIDLRVVALWPASVDVEIQNGSGEHVVFLNPEAPTRQIDEARCELILSTKVLDDVRPYAFTPRLEHVSAGSTRQFRAMLEPMTVPALCSKWTVRVEYAYLLPDDVENFEGHAREEFRQHVLTNQRVVSTSAARRIKQHGWN
jgi:hypothetical protein